MSLKELWPSFQPNRGSCGIGCAFARVSEWI
jgi:hypothetical protein